MTFGGWATFILSVGSFTALFAWCLYRVVFSDPPGDGSSEAPGFGDGKPGARGRAGGRRKPLK